MNNNSTNGFIAGSRAVALGATFALSGGCVLDPISIITDPIMYAAAPDPDTYAAQYQAELNTELKNTFLAQYRGETCAQITAFWTERMASVAQDPSRWGGPPATEAVQQVVREKNCPLPDSSVTTTAAPAAAGAPAPAPVERDPASFAALIANPGAAWGPVSHTGGAQSSLAQWVAQETPAAYQGRSCDYLGQALAVSRAMEANSMPEAQAWGAYKRVAVRQVLDQRDCPVWNASGIGRIGVATSPMDPIKARRLNMPLQGTSVEIVKPGGNGERAGLQFADVVVAVGTTPTNDQVDFLVAIGAMPTGSTAQFKVWRRGSLIDVPVVIGPPLPSPATSTAEAKPAKPATPGKLLDMQLAPVNPHYAAAVGLSETKGAWIVETSKGGQAERAGLRPLDVILEVSGQDVISPEDFATVAAKTRKGYGATVVVWRAQARKELKVVLNDGSLQ
ncbi:Do family serine endopeptidase [Pseudomonas wadenswilerensis]